MHRSSYCGVNCEKCKVYVATMADDDNLKAEVAREWSLLYKNSFTKEKDFIVSDMICHGCKSDIRFGLCKLCDIPECNIKHNVENCEDCAQFPCERIQRFFEYHKNNDTGAVFE